MKLDNGYGMVGYGMDKWGILIHIDSIFLGKGGGSRWCKEVMLLCIGVGFETDTTDCTYAPPRS